MGAHFRPKVKLDYNRSFFAYSCKGPIVQWSKKRNLTPKQVQNFPKMIKKICPTSIGKIILPILGWKVSLFEHCGWVVPSCWHLKCSRYLGPLCHRIEGTFPLNNKLQKKKTSDIVQFNLRPKMGPCLPDYCPTL